MRTPISLLLSIGLLACGSTGTGDGIEEGRAPQKVTEMQTGFTPLHLIVSNQSFDLDPASINVYVDDQHVISGDFLVEGQHSFHNFDFSVFNGQHTIRAEGAGISYENHFDVSSETWGTLMFWYYETAQGGQEPTPKSFSWHVGTEAPRFE